MNRLDTTSAALTPLPAAPVRSAGPASATSPTLSADRAGAGLDPLVVKLGPAYGRLLQAAQANDVAGARAALAELEPLIAKGQGLAAGSPHAAAFAKVQAAAEAVRAQLPAGETQKVMIGLPGRGGRMVEVETPAAPARRGPLGWFGDLVGGAGKLLTGAMQVVFAPLTLVGKVLDPIREGAGKLLGGLKAAIDGSIGQIPVLGQAVRFTTGLTSSLVGLVDGALHGITHPVELVQGLGHMAWTALGLVPGVRTAWDMGVHGMSPTESLGKSWGEAGSIGKAFFQNAIDDVKAGNWSGALGRVTGDIGSFFVTGGAAAGAKTAGVGSTVAKASRLARIAEVTGLTKVVGAGRIAEVSSLAKAAKLDAVVATGAKGIRIANDAGARIMLGGLKGNFKAWSAAGRLVREVPAAQRVMRLAESSAARFRGIKEGQQASPAAAVRAPKQATPFTPAQLAGEVQIANPLTREQALARQAEVLKALEGHPALPEVLADTVISKAVDNAMDHNQRFTDAVRGLRIKGKPVTSLEEAALAWKELPADSPLRIQVGKQLAAHLQQAFQDGLGFPPAAVEFRNLADNLAGIETRGKVLLDPAILHEDLDFLVHVLAEEQTHAYQRFLVDNQAALPLAKRMAGHVEGFRQGLMTETYVYPPSQALTSTAEQIKALTRGAADHADDIDYLTVRKAQVKQMLPGSVERARADDWWAKVNRPSKEISLYKYAQTDLKAIMREGGSHQAFRADYVERLPAQIFERNGVRLTPAETAKALDELIASHKKTLATANGEVEKFASEWKSAYERQSLEFVAQGTADDVAKWIMNQ